LAHCAPASILPRGIQAVATVFENEAVMKMADAVPANVVRRIDPLLNLVKEVADTTEGVFSDARKAADILYSTCEEARDKLHKVLNR